MIFTQKKFDRQALAQLEFEKYINSLAENVAPEFEIDSIADNCREVYRVWQGSHLLGTFYQNIQGKWIAQPCNADKKLCCGTPGEAQVVIIVAGLAQKFP